MPKKHNIKLDYKHNVIDVKKIDPCPFQVRKYFDEDKLKELATSIQREGLIEPIVVRRKKDHYELIAGERRFRAIRLHTHMQTLAARIVAVDEIGARPMIIDSGLNRLKIGFGDCSFPDGNGPPARKAT